MAVKMAVTLSRALTFLHLIALCHLETSRPLSEITGNQCGYVFSSFYQDFHAAIATKHRAAFYLPSKPYAVKLKIINCQTLIRINLTLWVFFGPNTV